ncbi:hypothetical protein A1O1_05898 [Capronia coronata CBS 617.96]|uniref:PLD phosphodiesterase domain-containing protein n=1 Tax=Capronia coronata CBS 617.96 TaxID=1182541 RepID=W9YTC5_9EURO|nr:uncharacterized protein A1O1_05898 [Capronia coronata CBS 617.96]EXJ85534.1 hypothetical protein A1O1_05898 [Capronia coronata CBS 617.96]
MPPNTIPPDIVDLSSDDDSGAINTVPAAIAPSNSTNSTRPGAPQSISETQSGRSLADQVPVRGRLHGGYDLDTLKYEEHLIPDGQSKCRGCRLSPVEFDEKGDEIPAAVTHEKRMTILMDRFKEKWAREDAQKIGTGDNQDAAANTVTLDDRPIDIHNVIISPRPNITLAEGRANKAIPTHVVDLEAGSAEEQSTGSRTETGSDVDDNDDDDLQIQSTSGGTSRALTQGARRSLAVSNNKGKGKGKAREQASIPEIDLSLLESDNDDDLNMRANSSDAVDANRSDEEDLRRAIALSLRDDQALDTVDNAASSSSQQLDPKRRTFTHKVGGATEGVTIPPNATSISGNNHNKDTRDPQTRGQYSTGGVVDRTEQTLLHDVDDDKTVSPSPRAVTSFSSSSQIRALPQAAPRSSTMAPSSKEAKVVTQTSNPPPSSFHLTGLDRKQMEAERLARLKRKREGEGEGGGTEDTTGPSSNRNKAARVDHLASGPRAQGTISPPPLRRSCDTQSIPAQKRQLSTTASASASTTGPSFKKGPVLPSGSTSHNGTVPSTMKAGGIARDARQNYHLKGVVLKTHVEGYGADKPNSNSNTIDFATLISPASSLESCLLSSFIWNFDWLFQHFDTKRTKFQLVMHAKVPGQREALKADFQGIPNVRLCFPPMEPNVNCMHSKLMLLFYKEEGGPRCRIVVPTANLVDFDWGVGGFMENTVWLIDLPMKKPGSSATGLANLATHGPTVIGNAQPDQATATTQFQKALTTFLKAQRVPNDVIRKLELFDFSETAQLGFVHTIGGMHVGASGGLPEGLGQSWRTTGVCGLGQTVTDLGLAGGGSGHRAPIELDYVTSSLGSLTDDFMSSMYLAAQGDDGLEEYNRRTGSSSSKRITSSTSAAKKGSGARMAVPKRADSGEQHVDIDSDHDHRHYHYDWKEKMRVYYPSDETVRRSKGGPANAGTICFSSKWWQNGKFPQSNLRDCVSVRQGLLMHNKLMFVRYAAPVETGGFAKMGWAYVGSANLSESAWGRLVQDKATKQPKLNCRNWECGVIIPLTAEDNCPSTTDNKEKDMGQKAGLEMFDHLVPVPMRYPAERLEGKKPWTMFD